MTRYVFGALSALTLGLAAAAAPAPADLVLIHGKVHTEDASRSLAQALAIRGNTIVAVGTDESVAAFVGPNTRTVDLGGRVVLPGIIDAHTHPAQSAQDLGKCSLDDKALAPPEIKNRVALCLKERPGERSQWFEVVMVNPSGLTLTLADLDGMLADIDQTRRLHSSRRDELTAALDPELVALYERQRAGGGPGAGPLQGRRCGACRIEIDRGEMSRISAAADDEVLRCPECGAILLRVKGATQ